MSLVFFFEVDVDGVFASAPPSFEVEVEVRDLFSSAAERQNELQKHNISTFVKTLYNVVLLSAEAAFSCTLLNCVEEISL